MGFGLMRAVDELAIVPQRGQPSPSDQKHILCKVAVWANDDGAPICWHGTERLAFACGISTRQVPKVRKALVAAGHISILEFKGRPAITIVHIGRAWQRGNRQDGPPWDATPCAKAISAKLAEVDRLTPAMRKYAEAAIMQLDPAHGGHFHYTPDATSPLPPRHPRRDSAQPLTPVRSTPDAPSPENNRPQSNNNPYPCPAGVDPLDWEGLMANRKAKRAPMTPAAYRQIIKKLDGWAAEGWAAGPIVAHAAEQGWKTVWPTDEMKGIAHGTRKRDNRDGLAKALDRRLAELNGPPTGDRARDKRDGVAKALDRRLAQLEAQSSGSRTTDAANSVAARMGIEGFGGEPFGQEGDAGRIIEMPDTGRALGDGNNGTK